LTTNEPQLGRGEGWILFAGITLVFAGILNSIWGIAAIDDSAYWGKAGWMVFVIVVPFLGVCLYLIGQHDEMRNRNLAQARSRRRRSTSTCAIRPAVQRGDRQGEGVARQGRDHPGGVRRPQHEGDGLNPPTLTPIPTEGAGALTGARGQEVVGPCPRRRRPTAT
jgi:hypothetical protein